MKNISDYDTSNFSYDPTPGLITNNKTGKTYTKNTQKGYITISMRHKVYGGRITIFAHRLAWYLYYGTEPNIIDHVSGAKDDNRISNLSSVNTKQNNQNRSRNKNSKTLPGAFRTKHGTFMVKTYSSKTGELVYLGSYANELDANYVATFYKQTHYHAYKGTDIIHIPTHPYFTGTLATIMQTINDTSGKAALNYMSR